VLVVEDDASALAAIAEQLSTAGYDPVCVSSAEEALRVAMREGADLALVDRSLPGACGSSLVRWLRASSLQQVRSIPVIGISASKQSERDLVAAGAVCFLAKPLDETKLKKTLEWTESVYWTESG
jgi:CheY-like chemotaxis protein